MKRLFLLTIILVTSTACSMTQNMVLTENPATDLPQAAIPNPASVFCVQQGNKHEIRTAADGSQSGVCVFPDGTTCDEWAYFKGECELAPENSTTPTVA